MNMSYAVLQEDETVTQSVIMYILFPLRLLNSVKRLQCVDDSPSVVLSSGVFQLRSDVSRPLRKVTERGDSVKMTVFRVIFCF